MQTDSFGIWFVFISSSATLSLLPTPAELQQRDPPMFAASAAVKHTRPECSMLRALNSKRSRAVEGLIKACWCDWWSFSVVRSHSSHTLSPRTGGGSAMRKRGRNHHEDHRSPRRHLRLLAAAAVCCGDARVTVAGEPPIVHKSSQPPFNPLLTPSLINHSSGSRLPSCALGLSRLSLPLRRFAKSRRAPLHAPRLSPTPPSLLLTACAVSSFLSSLRCFDVMVLCQHSFTQKM